MRERPGLPENDETLIMSRLSGRENEADALHRALEGTRLVVVSGPPGVGKSALAEHVLRPRTDTVHISLASFDGEPQCIRKVLETLGAEAPADEDPDASWNRLERVLADQSGVVVFDDADGWPRLEARIETLVSSDSSFTVLVTRQAAWRSRGARELKLRGLPTADGVDLFVTRSNLHNPSSAQEVIEEIVREVDGNPLAIELAASRTLLMSPGQILDRLTSSLDVLKSSRQGDPRHQSLDTALQLAWSRLSADQRVVHMASARLGAMLGLEAIEFVCAESVKKPCADVLEELIMDSLIRTEAADGSVRFRMSRAVRAFSRSRLEEQSGSVLSARARAWILQRAEQLAASLEGPDSNEAFARVQNLSPMLIEEVESCLDEAQFRQAAELMLTLRHLALMRGPLESYEALFERLDRSAIGASLRARIVVFEAELRLIRGERFKAETLVREHLIEDAQGRIRIELLRILGMVRATSDPEEAEERLREALELARDAADRFAEARVLERLGFLAVQTNRIDRAWIEFSEARQIFELLQTPVFLGDSTTGLGYVELRKNRLSEAAERLRDAVELHERLENHFHLAAARFNLGVVLHANGRLEEARAQLEDASASWQDGGFIRHRVPAMLRLAMVEIEAGQEDAARSLLSEVIHLSQVTSDHHNGAIAISERAAIDHFANRPVDVARVEGALQGMLVGADPDAFGSALSLLTVLSGRENRPTLPYVNRLEELVALFAEDDDYSRSTVTYLRDIARAWHLVSLAENQDAPGASRESHLAAAHDAVSELLARDQVTSPLVRIWLRRLHTVDAFESFMPLDNSEQTRLRLHREGMWYAVDDLPAVDLSTRRPLSLIMRRFARCIDEGHTQGLEVDEVAEAGWPGEPLQLSTRRNRVYTAIRFLREMDLEEILVTSDTGYRLAENVVVRLTDERLHG